MRDSATQGDGIFETVAAFRDCRTPAEVGALLVSAIAPLGLSHYAIGAMPRPEDRNLTPFIYHNWPERWTKTYFERNFALIDPVPRAAMACAMPLTLGELKAGKAGFVPGPETDDYFALGDEMAAGRGLIVPIAGPQGYHAIAVLAGQREDFSCAERAGLHLLALYAHCRLRDLFAQDGAFSGPHLSQREIEVLRLARQGLGDEGIALSLAISVRTVRFHFDNARRKLGARSRAEALVTAVGLHLLSA